MTKKLSVWVPGVLNEEQKYQRWHCCQQNKFNCINREKYLKKIIAIDESGVPSYAPTPRHQRGFWVKDGEPVPKIPKPKLYEEKLMLVVGMDFDGVAFWDVLEPGNTMTADRYKSFLDHHVSKWQTDKNVSRPHVLHDNAKPHKGRVVMELIQSKRWSILPHPPYSPDFNPVDYNCFGNLKMKLSGKRYANLESLKKAIGNNIKVVNEN